MSKFQVGDIVWGPYLSEEWSYVPKEVRIVYGPDSENVYCVLKITGKIDTAKSSTLHSTHKECMEYIKQEKYND